MEALGQMRTQKNFVYLAFGWLVFTGTARFIVDVLSQRLRSMGRGRKRRSTKS